jgi:hypothetical protein
VYINYEQFLLSIDLSRKIKKIYAFITVGRENHELSRVAEEYKPSVFYNRTLRKTVEPKGRFTHNMPCPCRVAKGLECVFPI